MVKNILNIIVGLTGVISIILFSVAYGVACIFFGWLPDLSFKDWALITGFLSLSVLCLSIGLWFCTSYKESIHGWILLPGIVVGKVWISSSSKSFSSWLGGSILVSLIFIVLVLGEVFRTWSSKNRIPMSGNSRYPNHGQ